MATNYTNEQVSYMIDKYNESPTRDTVQILAEELGKSTKSIIGKLSREGVYQKAQYVSKTGSVYLTILSLFTCSIKSIEKEL